MWLAQSGLVKHTPAFISLRLPPYHLLGSSPPQTCPTDACSDPSTTLGACAPAAAPAKACRRPGHHPQRARRQSAYTWSTQEEQRAGPTFYPRSARQTSMRIPEALKSRTPALHPLHLARCIVGAPHRRTAAEIAAVPLVTFHIKSTMATPGPLFRLALGAAPRKKACRAP